MPNLVPLQSPASSQKAESEEQRAGTREQRAENRDLAYFTDNFKKHRIECVVQQLKQLTRIREKFDFREFRIC